MGNKCIPLFVRKELRAVTVGLATAIGIGGMLPAAMAAGPTGGTVVSGSGTITHPSATTTLIDQETNQLTLNWSSFDVPANDRVQFDQPSATSVALNLILSQSPSQIFGQIDANGRVVLVNPNGILFGPTAQLNVGSLIASSLEVTGFDAASGRFSFQALTNTPGAIVNEGTITAAHGGSVALLGGTVLNDGLVVADYGTVAMGAGKAATLDFYGGGLLRLQVSGDLKTNSTGAGAAVTNDGRIEADGGQVMLTASAAKQVFASAVNNSGVIHANRIENVGGVIELTGSDGAVSSSGTLDASGKGAASTGGTVTVTGSSVSLTGTAKVDVSGAAGGGSALIGGGLHGADSSVPDAAATTVDAGASIQADATHAGNGGTIVVWSNGKTTAHGQLSAAGGPAGGNGGLIETSGHVLDVNGIGARAAAAAGKAGTWLLDPTDVVIDHGTGSSISGGNNGNGTSPVYDGDINAALAGGTDVTVQTSSPPATSSTATGSITFGPGVAITNNDAGVTRTLTLSADTGIDLTNATAPSITSGTGALDLVLKANANGQASPSSLGTVTLDGTINVNTLTVSGTAAITQPGGTLTVAGATSLNAGTADISLARANTFSGNVAFSGNNVTLSTGTGGLSSSGTAGGTLTETAAGAITQGGALDVTGASTLTAGSGTADITLGGSNTFSGNVAFSGNNVTLTTGTGGLSSSGTAGGNLSETAAGAITQGGALDVTGTSALMAAAGTGDITLGGANTFVGNVAFDGNNVTLSTGTGGLSSSGIASGNLSETAAGAITQGGALDVTGTSTLTAAAGTADITLGGANTFAGNIAFSGNNVTLSTGTGGLSSSGTASGNLSETAAGAITQGGALDVTGASTLTAASGTADITLGGANTFSGNVAFSGNNVTLTTGTGGLSSSGTAGGTLTETAAGAITQGGALDVTGASTLTANDAGNVTLSNAANSFNGAVTLSGNTVTLANSVGTTLAGASSAASLTLDAGGAVTFGTTGTDSTTVTNGLIVQGVSGSGAAGGAVSQVGTLRVGTTSNVDAGANAITLGNPGNSFGGNVTFAGAAVTLADSGALSSAGTASANLSETAAGTIGEGAAGIQLTGTAGASTATFTVTGGAHDVSLGSAANNFNDDATTVAASGGGSVGNVWVADTNVTFVPLTLPATLASLVLSDANAPIALGAQTLTGVGGGTNLAGGSTALAVTAGGAITQSGVLNVTGTSALTAAAGTADITLGGANSFGGNVAFTGHNVTLTTGTGGLSSSGTASGDLSETAAGTIGEGAAGIRLTGTAGASTATFTVTGGAHDVSLGSAGNNFNDDATTVTASGGGSVGNVWVADANATFVPLTLPATLASLVLSDANAPIGLGAETLTGVGGGTNLAGGSTALAVSAGGAITQSGALDVTGTSALTAGNGAADITLAQANRFGGNVAFTGRNVTLSTGTGGLTSSGTASGNLSETVAGTIGEGAAGIQLTGTAGASTATFTVTGSAHDVSLGSAANNFNDDAATVTAAGGGSVGNVWVADTNATFVPLTLPATLASLVLSDANAPIALGAQTLTGVGGGTNLAGGSTALAVSSGGAITQSGVLDVTGTSALTAGNGAADITLAQANSFGGNVAFTGHNVTLSTGTGGLSSSGTASGNLTETAAGAITQGGALDVTGTSTLTAGNGAANITLGGANSFGGNVAFSGNDVTLSTGTGGLSSSGTAGGTLGETTAGAITQGGVLNVTGATTLTAGNGAADITLAQSNSFSGNVAFTGRNVTLSTGTGGLTSSGTASGNLSETAAGTIGEGAAGIRLTGTAGASTATFTVTGGAHDVSLGSAANNFNDDATTVTAAGGGSVGNVWVADANATFVPLRLPATLASLVLSDANAPIALGAETLTGVGGGTNLAGGSTALAVSAGGAITQSGALDVTGTSALTAGNGAADITLGGANSFGGNVAFGGHNVTLTTGTGGLSSSGTASGNLTETAAGAITQGGVLDVTGTSTLTAGNGAADITLGGANSFGGNVAFSGNDVMLSTGTGGLSSSGTAAGTLTETAAGAITQGGALNVTGATTLTAANGAANITLGGANSFGGNVAFDGNDVTLRAGTLTTAAGGLSASGTAAASLTLAAEGASSNLTLGAIKAGGDVLLIAGNSILGTGPASTVSANDIEVRYGIQNPNGQLSGTSAGQQLAWQASSGSTITTTVWAPTGTQSPTKDVALPSGSILKVTEFRFPPGNPGLEAALYTAPFGASASQITAGAAITLTSATFSQVNPFEQSAGDESASGSANSQLVYIDWASYNPNVSLFGTLNPAVCLPADQRVEGTESSSACAAPASVAALTRTPTPILLSMVLTQQGWREMPLFGLPR